MSKYSSWSDKELIEQTYNLKNLAEGVQDIDFTSEVFDLPQWASDAIRAELATTRSIVEELQQRGYGQGGQV